MSTVDSTLTTPLPLPEGMRAKGIEASGMVLHADAPGSLRAGFDQLLIRDLRIATPWAAITVGKLCLTQAMLRLASTPASSSFDLKALSAQQVQLEGIEATLSGAPTSTPDSSALRIEPLGRLQGALQIFIRDAAWVVDAEITMPIVNGRLDFNRVVVEHIGPNSSMGMDRGGVYIEAPNRGRTELFRFSAPVISGASYDMRGGFGGHRVTDRGGIDIPLFVQGLLHAGMGQPLGQIAGREVEVMLDRTKLDGELRLGDGVLGTDRQQLVLAGEAQGRNRIALSAAVLGQRLVMRLPELAASRAVFELLGQAGSTGAISAMLEAHVTGLSRGSSGRTARGVTLMLHRMTVRDVQLGRVDDQRSTH